MTVASSASAPARGTMRTERTLARDPDGMPELGLLDRRGPRAAGTTLQLLAILLVDRLGELLDEFPQRHAILLRQPGPRLAPRDHGTLFAQCVSARRFVPAVARHPSSPSPSPRVRRRQRRSRLRHVRDEDDHDQASRQDVLLKPGESTSRARVPTSHSTTRRAKRCSTRRSATSTTRCSRRSRRAVVGHGLHGAVRRGRERGRDRCRPSRAHRRGSRRA